MVYTTTDHRKMTLLTRLLQCVTLLRVFMVVNGAISCSRCKVKISRNKFEDRIFFCSSTGDDGGGFIQPGDIVQQNSMKYACECTEFREEYDDPYFCFISQDFGPEDYCKCSVKDKPLCPANTCDYTYQCGSTLYICWNLISPQDIGVCTDCQEAPNTPDGIETVEHCFDVRKNGFKDVGIDGCETLCQRNPDNDPESIIGILKCPNEETVDRYTKFCTPPGPEGKPDVGDFFQCPGSQDDPCISCEVPFCKYETPITLTVFGAVQLDPPFISTTAPVPPKSDETKGKGKDAKTKEAKKVKVKRTPAQKVKTKTTTQKGKKKNVFPPKQRLLLRSVY